MVDVSPPVSPKLTSTPPHRNAGRASGQQSAPQLSITASNTAGCLTQARSPARLRIEDAAAGTQLPHTLELRIRRGGDPHLAADRGRDLDSEGRHPAAGARHQDAASRAGARTGDRSPPGRESGKVQCSRLLPRKGGRPRRDVGRRYHDPVGKGAVARRAQDLERLGGYVLAGIPAERRVDHDLVSHRDRRDAGAHRGDHPGGVGAERHRRAVRGLPPDPPVSPVQRRGDDTHDHLAVTGNGLGHIHLPEDGRVPGADQAHRSHRGYTSS